MIRLEMSGGLGNQMFQYSAGRLFQSFHNDPVVYHYIATANLGCDDRKIAIGKYSIPKDWNRLPDAENIFSGYKFRHFIYRLFSHFTYKRFGAISTAGDKEKHFFRFKWNILNRFGIYLQEYDYCFPIKKSWFKDIFVLGMWQAPQYFEKILPQLRIELRLQQELLTSRIQSAIKQMQDTNSVCVHVRRGDYLRLPGYYVCSNSYYKRAAEKICSLVENPIFYFFSDDIEWVKENLTVPGHSCYYMDGNNKDYLDFEIMRNAKHFILSNSTYSYWASTLGTDPSKRVCAPDRWFSDDRGRVIYRKDWILIDTNEIKQE